MNLTRIILPCAFALASAALAQAGGVDFPQGALLRTSDGSFLGTSAGGGTGNLGTIFRVTPESEVSVLVSFTGDAGAAKGAQPQAGLVDDGTGVLWGTTEQGGASGLGTIFKFDPTSGVLTTVVEFAGSDGSNPVAELVSDGAGKLWGTTRTGGANDHGTVFTVNVADGALATIVEFTGTSGAAMGSQPKAALVRDDSGTWWGTTSMGGTGGLGTIFSIDPSNGNAFTSELAFTGTNGAALGSAPEAAMTMILTGQLWGTTRTGGTSNLGTIFIFSTATKTLSTVVNFNGTNGAYPRAPLRLGHTPMVWGTTSAGGNDDLGTIFRLSGLGLAHTVVASFTGTTGAARGAYPVAPLVRGADGELWGVASKGGRDDRGTIFKLLTATGEVQLVAEPEFAPVKPLATVQPPPASVLTGAAGTPITLRGTAKDNIELLSVIVSINGGPFLPATLIPPAAPGRPWTWQIDVIPENGVNVVVIKSVDNGGNAAKPVTLVFNYTVIRTDVAGSYSGLVIADASSATPLQHTGSLRLKVNARGRFTGTLTLGGLALPVPLKGSIGNGGAARFGRTGTTRLSIPRGRNLPPLLLSLVLDVDAPYSRQLTGALREGGAIVGAVSGGQNLYTAKLNPPAPLQGVPPALLGRYSAVFHALTPAEQGRPASDFPQADGSATMTVAPSGVVKISGRLADGAPFTASAPLAADDTLPFFAKLYAGKGAISGPVVFRSLAQSDADCAGMPWFRPENSKAADFPNGWPTGIKVNFTATKSGP